MKNHHYKDLKYDENTEIENSNNIQTNNVFTNVRKALRFILYLVFLLGYWTLFISIIFMEAKNDMCWTDYKTH